MSLAFLSKKTWHVTNFSNQEAVWKAEQAKDEENRKLEEWKTKREEERQIEELRRLQRESGQGESSYGGKHKQERVDFLYEQQSTSGVCLAGSQRRWLELHARHFRPRLVE